MHVFNVGHFGLKIIARHGKILGKYRWGFTESYQNQPIFKLQRLLPKIRPTTPPNLPTSGIYLKFGGHFDFAHFRNFLAIKLCKSDCPSTFPQKYLQKFYLVKTRPV